MRFTKMHGLGNNYIFINLLEMTLAEQELASLARAVSNVNTGIGSDGMILILPSQKADFRMRIFNADGSEGQNCGNGLRCLARYVYDHGLTTGRQITIETRGRIVRAEILPEQQLVKVDMGRPDLLKGALPMLGDPNAMSINEAHTIDDQSFRFTCLSMGNPHAILFVDNVQRFPLTEWGPRIEHAPLFPERVNAGIVCVLGNEEIDYRVWERGSGITMACGTGACAAVVAATLTGKLSRDRPITVHLPGGDLTIRWDRQGHVWKTGPAAYICEGDLLIKSKGEMYHEQTVHEGTNFANRKGGERTLHPAAIYRSIRNHQEYRNSVQPAAQSAGQQNDV